MNFEIRCDGVCESLDVETLAEAREAAEAWLQAGWDETEKTIWVHGYLDGEDEDGDEVNERIKVQIDPEEPQCPASRDHDWRSPYAILGGLEENPGVWGHGGGVIIREVCMHCGCERVTDTWAQDPETGEQGLESVSYEPRKYADEIEQRLRASGDF